MRLFPCLISLGSASRDLEAVSGTVHTHLNKINSASDCSKIGNGPLRVSPSVATFTYFANGMFQLAESEEFLILDEFGIFYMSKRPQKGFHLAKQNDSSHGRVLFYNECAEFQIYRHGQIGYKSTCAEACDITITFKEAVIP